MRVWNVMLVLILNYAIIFGVSAILEIDTFTTKATHVKHIIETAGDLTLSQTQALDDFISTDENAYQILSPNDDYSEYIMTDVYDYLYGLDSTVRENKEKIFNKLYVNQEFQSFASRTGAIRRSAKFYQDGDPKNPMVYYKVPVISKIGTSILPQSNVTKLKQANGSYAPQSVSNSFFSLYNSVDTKKYNTVGEEDSEANYYYNSPISMGITYLDETMLSRLFVANVDSLMRYKYVGNYSRRSGLNTEDGGYGVYKGVTSSDRVVENALSEYNPINDGLFTFLRGRDNPESTYDSYEGVKPKVEYKVIDMYDSANDGILVRLFGANKGGNGSKAQYLKSLDADVIDPATGGPFEHKYFVVAKVTFYADILLPFSNIALREFAGRFPYTENNYVGLKATEDAKGVGNSIRYEYTTFFAVTP